MAKTWAEITADQEFQGLPAADQETVREAFWQKRVVPTLEQGADVEQARAYFDQRTRIRKQDLPENVTPSEAGAGRGLAARGMPTLGERMQQGMASLADVPAPTERRRGGLRSEAQPYVPDTENGGTPQPSNVKPILSPLEVPTNPNMAFGDWSRGQRQMDNRVADAKSMGAMSPVSRSQQVAFDVEDKLRDSNPVVRGAVQGFAGLGKIGPGAARIAGDFLGIDTLRDMGAGAAQIASGTEQGAAAGLNGNEKLAADITSSIVNSTPTMLLGMGGGPALRTLFATSAMQEYNTGRDTGFSPGESLGRAAIYGMAEAMGERFGFPEQVKLLKTMTAKMPQGEVAKLFGAMLAKEIPGEELTTAIQFMADKVGPAAQKPNATLADYLNEAADTFKVTVGQSLVMGGGPAALHTGRAVYGNVNQAQAAPEQRAAQAISEAASAYYRPAPEATTPTAARADSLKRFDEAAAAWGLSPKAASAVREQAGSMPSDDVPGFLARVTASMAKRGLFRKPVDDKGLQDLDKRLRPAPEEPAQPESPNVNQPDVEATAGEPVGAGDGGSAPAARSGGTVGPEPDAQRGMDRTAGAPEAGGDASQPVPDGAGGLAPALTSKRTPEDAIGMMAEQDRQDYNETRQRSIAADNAPAFEDPASDDILSEKGKPWASKTLANRRLRDLPNGYRLARTAKGWVIKPENIANPATETPAGGQPVPTTKASNESLQGTQERVPEDGARGAQAAASDGSQEGDRAPAARQDGADQQDGQARAQPQRAGDAGAAPERGQQDDDGARPRGQERPVPGLTTDAADQAQPAPEQSRAPEAAAPASDQQVPEPVSHAVGSTVTLDGKRHTVAKTGKASVTLEGEDGKKRTVQVSAPAYGRIILPADSESRSVAVKQQLFVEGPDGKKYPVADMSEAQAKWTEFRDATGEGVSQVGNGVRVVDQDGKLVGRVSYNGRAWDAQDKVIAEAPDQLPKTDKAEMRPYRRADGSIGYEAVPIIPPAPKPEAKAEPAAPLYASRAVTNAQAIIDWARSQGFKSTLKPEDLHVTIAYSRDAVDGAAMPKDTASLTASGGKRSVEPLGEEGAVVLKFNSPELQARWKAYRDAGASWDYDAYTPHVTITYDGKGLDLAKVQPYTGPIELGAEQQEPLNVNKKDDYKESSAPPAAEPNNPERPEALIELRKRLSVLEALRRCIGP